jgi:hypothetical protein
MSSLATAGLVFACALGAALAAMLVARRLPAHHLSGESMEVVKLGLGVIATLTALVLGLLVASAKSTYDAQNASVKQLAANVSLLDRALTAYGPDAKELRQLLRDLVAQILERVWPEANPRAGDLTVGETREAGDVFFAKLTLLEPKTDAQRALKGRSVDLAVDLAKTRYQMQSQKDNPVPVPFLVVLILWMAVLYTGYGLLAPPNPTVIIVLVICALSIAAALFLVLELGRPFAGVIQVSSAPLQEALSQLGKP